MLSSWRTVIALPFGIAPGRRCSTVSSRLSFALADELQDEGCDECLGDAADSEPVARAQAGLLVQVSVAACEQGRVIALPAEHDGSGHAGGDELVERVLQLRRSRRGGCWRRGGGGSDKHERKDGDRCTAGRQGACAYRREAGKDSSGE
jgi:hypothetical protein